MFISCSTQDEDIKNQVILKGNEQSSIKISSFKLNSIMNKLSIKKIDYCKINIEGAEKDALMGIDIRNLYIKNFCISTHDFIGPSFRTYDFVKSWLGSNNYNVIKYPNLSNNYWENYYVYGVNNN